MCLATNSRRTLPTCLGCHAPLVFVAALTTSTCPGLTSDTSHCLSPSRCAAPEQSLLAAPPTHTNTLCLSPPTIQATTTCSSLTSSLPVLAPAVHLQHGSQQVTFSSYQQGACQSSALHSLSIHLQTFGWCQLPCDPASRAPSGICGCCPCHSSLLGPLHLLTLSQA